MDVSQTVDDLLQGVDLDELDDFDLADSNVAQQPVPFVGFSGFKTAGGSSLAPPSAAALARAQKLFDDVTRQTQEEEAVDNGRGRRSPTSSPAIDQGYTGGDSPSKRRKVESSSFTTAAGRVVPPPSAESRNRIAFLFDDEDPALPVSPPEPTSAAPNTPKPLTIFHQQANNTVSAVPVGIGSASTPRLSFRAPLSHRTPLQSRTNLPSPRSVQIKTPAKNIGVSTQRAPQSARSKFTTPFKTPTIKAPVSNTPMARPPRADVRVFDLTTRPERLSMRQAFLKPQFYSPEELQELGLPDDVWALDLENASRYSFIAENSTLLTHQTALRVLLDEGCHLATAKWVDNHWSQILWKLAGQIQAQPKLFDEKWNWAHVINQLKYRYEREILHCQRPIVRKIQEHDASAASPMVLVVSAVQWIGADQVQLVLTDGWYSIQAELDETLVRAVKAKRIVVGRKLAMSGSRLVSGQDGVDVLDALHKSHIKLFGNSCHLARWDTRLGVHLPFISSLSSITHDGGVISLMGLVVEKLYPVAFVPAVKGETYEPPWNEDEEILRQEAWKEKYEAALALKTEAVLASIGRLQDIVEILASQAEIIGGGQSSSEDDLDGLLDELIASADVAQMLRALPSATVASLAIYGRERLGVEYDAARRTAEQEAQIACPPRQIREFRSAKVVDMVLGLRSPFREGLLNVWDSRTVALEEGGRYFVSNLYPSKSGDWSIPKKEGALKQVYLHTRRDTKWQSVVV